VAVLSKLRSPTAIGLLLGLTCAGCLVLDALGPHRRALAFSHRLHVQEEELDCVSCHEGAQVEAHAGLPGPDACDVCHELLDEERPPERAVSNLFEDEVFHAERGRELSDEILFSHPDHVARIEDCGTCHLGIATNEDVLSMPPVDMAACIDCHEASGRRDECATCHERLDRTWEPPGHALDWIARHGRASRGAHPATVDDCRTCHEPASCESCHRLEPPRGHDAHFRRRGHGLLAQVDRAACATCHEPATCDRCHADIRPLSHAGALWGGTRDTHCLTCHFPLGGESCSTCHRGTPSHARGPAKPSWHDPAMNCRACHGNTLPLRHVDNGSNCNLCHP
jgi:hypothetical protein